LVSEKHRAANAPAGAARKTPPMDKSQVSRHDLLELARFEHTHRMHL